MRASACCSRAVCRPSEQDLDDPDVGSVLQKMCREAVAQRVQRDALGQARSLHRRPAGGIEHGLIDRMIFVATKDPKNQRALSMSSNPSPATSEALSPAA